MADREDRPGDAMETGVKVVGAPAPTHDPETAPATPSDLPARPKQGSRAGRSRGLVALWLVALLGMGGTIGFGIAWANSGQPNPGDVQAAAGDVQSATRTFLLAFTNFDAKSIDADVTNITNMATGDFANQVTKFFNSSIRQQLQKALASSRGQIRVLYVEKDDGTHASVYAVVDQIYINNKITTPQTDVLRVVVDLTKTSTGWKVSNLTVLEGPTAPKSGTSGTSSTGQ